MMPLTTRRSSVRSAYPVARTCRPINQKVQASQTTLAATTSAVAHPGKKSTEATTAAIASTLNGPSTLIRRTVANRGDTGSHRAPSTSLGAAKGSGVPAAAGACSNAEGVLTSRE